VPRSPSSPSIVAPYRDLLGAYLRPQWRRASVLALLLLAAIALDLLNPQLLRLFIDTATGATRATAQASRTLTVAALAYLGVALVAQTVAVGETYAAENLGWTATNRLRADLALHCLHLDARFHNAHTPGELIERIDGDVATLSNFFARFTVHVLGNALLSVGVLALLFRIDGRIGAAATVFALVAVGIVLRLRNLAVPYWAAARQASAELFGFLEERLAGTEDVRANGGGAYALYRLHTLSRAVLRRERRAGIVSTATGGTTIVLFTLGTAISLGLGAYLYLGREISIGAVYLAFAYTDMLRRPIETLTRQMQDLQQATASMTRIYALLRTPIVIEDGPGAPFPDGALAVEIDGVTFGYNPDEPAPALRDVSLRLAPGETLGLLGRTGSGKTTLARLLCRLYDPTAGTIRVGGVPLRQARQADLHARVGLVTQDIQLFHATVRDNLTLFDRTVSDTRIERALDELGLLDWCRALPQGLDTRLAPGGGLSAGEAQLLAFTRVFLADPGLVILDEASSRLDPATERRVERAVDRLLAGRTAIIIAHRLATLGRVDTVLILERGRIAEYGPRAALARDPASRFAALLRAAASADAPPADLDEALV